MHDHRKRQGPLEPEGGAPAGKPARGPLGSAAFYVVLAAGAFLVWKLFTGGGGGPC
ncbi:MAG: hypothetical protein O2894_05690 [Planctomycetota bacterium]|nr:hypothetical protein [Planctomycetota bacterium]